MSLTSNPFPLCRKLDLETTPLVFGSERSWVVKDPISLRIFRLRDEEYTILSLLDGKRSLAAIASEYERRLPPQRMNPTTVLEFASRLHTQGLVSSNSADQGIPLSEAAVRRERAELRQTFANPLAIRFRGIDPRRFLDRLLPWTRFIFQPTGVITAATLLIAALLIVAVKSELLTRDLEKLAEPDASTWLVAVAALGGVKVLHEIGHGLSCRRFGGDSHELGFMLLFGVPCLYCNVTDSWRLPSKWQRICISAAGIYVELILASLAALGWAISTPGVFHDTCVGVMTICSINTIVLNGNPLMRYDGYFILADLVNQPNLGSTAREVFRASLQVVLSGWSGIDRSRLPKRNWLWFAGYHIASIAFRWTLIYSIVLLMFGKARSIQAEAIARLFLLAIVVTTSVGLMRGTVAYLRGQTVSEGRRFRRFAIASLFCSVGAVLLCVPLPHRVWGDVELAPHKWQPVYVRSSGRLIHQAVLLGTAVKHGDVIAKLTDEEAEDRFLKLRAEKSLLQMRLSLVEAERFVDPGAALRIPRLQESIREKDGQLRLIEEDRARLTLIADRDGIMLPGEISSTKESSKDQLPDWVGRPCEPENLGCRLERGTEYCLIGDPKKWDAFIALAPDDVLSVRVGDRVAIKFDCLPDEQFEGMVAELGQLEEKTPVGFESGDENRGTPGRMANVAIQVRIVLDDPSCRLRRGIKGTAKVIVESESVGRRIARWCRRTFYFDL